jgi:hypothetical protein
VGQPASAAVSPCVANTKQCESTKVKADATLPGRFAKQCGELCLGLQVSYWSVVRWYLLTLVLAWVTFLAYGVAQATVGALEEGLKQTSLSVGASMGRHIFEQLFANSFWPLMVNYFHY